MDYTILKYINLPVSSGYIANRLQVLKNNKTFIVKADGDATKVHLPCSKIDKAYDRSKFLP